MEIYLLKKREIMLLVGKVGHGTEWKYEEHKNKKE